MKTDTAIQKPEGRTIALLTGLSVGLGIALHKIFFLVAAAIALIVPIRGLFRYVNELEQAAIRHHPRQA